MIVVTGATGNVGRGIVERLAAGHEVTAVARRITAADVPDGVRAVAADLGDPASLEAVLAGAGALFLLVAGDDPDGIVAAARKAGVGRIVLLSSIGAGTRPEAYAHPAAFERAVRESGLSWTILRPGGFHTNAFAWLEPVRTGRIAPAPFADVALPTVDPADLAAVAATVLTTDGHDTLVYELTGPEATTPRQRAEALATALGEPIRFVEQSPAEARAQMITFMPEPVADATLAVLGEPVPAETRVSPDLEHLLGRSPRSFADWATTAAPSFR
ncbi:NAD(P)H-binding protein [Actinocorallia lasiicapitis]